MILHFININKPILTTIFILITAFFSCEAFPEQKSPYKLSNKNGEIFWRCDQGLCNTYLKLKNKTIEVISEKSSPPSVLGLNKNLTSLFFSCGAPCNYTKYYDVKKGISSSFEFAIAVDAQREIVVLAKSNKLVAFKIFGTAKHPLFTINRDWSPTAALYSGIIEAKFVGESLYIKYLEGANFREKEETIYNLHGRV